MKPIIILLACLIFIFFTGFVVLSFINYKKRFNVKYNPLNMFPYELNFEASFKDNFLGNLFLFFTSLISITFYVLIVKLSSGGFIIILAVAGILSSVLLAIVPLLHLKYLKTHIAVDIFFFIGVLVSIISNALICLNYYQTWLDSNNNPSFVLMIVYFVFGAIFLLILFNPKMSIWAKLEQVTNSDGTSYYKRPRFFPLAYTEWLGYVFYLLSIAITLTTYLVGIY